MKKLLTIVLIALSVNAYAQLPTNGLVGYWPFNGNANDVSGNGNNGAVSGSTLTTDKFGNPNSAYSFDGVNDYVMVADKDNLSLTSNNFTFSFWIYVNTGTNVNMGAIAKRKFDGMDASNWEYTLGIDANPNEFRYWFGNLQGNCGPYISPVDVTFTKGQWIHYVTTPNGTTIKFYKNGQLLSEGTRSQTCNFGNGSGPLLFGLGGGWNQMYYLNGKMDEIRIYNRALSQSEISILYNENICYQSVIVTDTLIINANFTGFNPVSYANTIKVYPNPTKDKITIDCGNNYSTLNGYTIKITNSLSQTVYTSLVNQQITTVDLNSWTGTGIYFVHLIDVSNNTLDIKKIVVQ